jgi:hypothetical protein
MWAHRAIALGHTPAGAALSRQPCGGRRAFQLGTGSERVTDRGHVGRTLLGAGGGFVIGLHLIRDLDTRHVGKQAASRECEQDGRNVATLVL